MSNKKVGKKVEIKNINELYEVLQVLANKTRLRMLGLVAERPMYITELSKRLRLSYPLTHLHISALERVGLVTGEYEFISGEKPHVRKYYRANKFVITISPEKIRELMGGKNERT